MENEVRILEDVSHPRIMRVYELLQDINHFYIVTEYIGHGELYQFNIQKNNSLAKGSLTEWEIIQIMKQIFQALNYMHS